ncbi:hypothetical protein C0992_008240, partial [Termitomyces sp. T32_za158]
RAGSTGASYTYNTTGNAKSPRELVAILCEAKAVVLPQLEEMVMYSGGGGGGRGAFNSFQPIAIQSRSLKVAIMTEVDATVTVQVVDDGQVVNNSNGRGPPKFRRL